MARLVELERGIWLEGLDQDLAREVEALCGVIENSVADAAVSLLMFERAAARSHEPLDKAAWEGHEDLVRRKHKELDVQAPWVEGEWSGGRATRLFDRARRDVIREKWESGEVPQSYAHRLPFLHARSFTRAVAQVRRAIGKLAELDTGDARAKIVAACGQFDEALPDITPVRDSIEHAEDRMRGLNRKGKPMTLAPISNEMIEAPSGGVLIGDSLINGRYGGTVDDGSHAEVDLADDTLEVVRVAVQRIFDALPWRLGQRRFLPD